MSNVLTTQILQDGPSNTVIKVEGIVDTSDISVTGTIGASGFTTTTGLKTITFVAGALVPTLGQYVTFGDSAATFVAGTYITGIIDATHITVSTAALKDNAAAAVTITGTTGVVVIVDPAKLSDMYPEFATKATKVKIKRVSYSIEDLLGVLLYWEATTNVRVMELVGQAVEDYSSFGGLSNNAGTGVTGKLVLATQGWSASAVLSFSLILELQKQ